MLRWQKAPHLADVIHHLIDMATAAFRQLVFVKARPGAEMLANAGKRLGQMNAARKVFGKKVLQGAEESACLGVSFEALPLRLVLASVRDNFQRVQALRDCHSMLVCERRRRHLDRLRLMIFVRQCQSATGVRSAAGDTTLKGRDQHSNDSRRHPCGSNPADPLERTANCEPSHYV